MKGIGKNILCILSSISMMVLAFPYNGTSLLFASIVLLIEIIILKNVRNSNFRMVISDKKVIIVSLSICICLGVKFYCQYRNFGVVARVADALKIDASIFIIALLIIFIIFSLLFCALLCTSFSSNSNAIIFNDKFIDYLDKKVIPKIKIALLSIAVLFMIFFSFNNYLWIDETFSLSIIDHSYSDVIALTAKDVHPPLYYIILKFFVDTINKILPNLSHIYIAKFVSVLPFIILVIIIFLKNNYYISNANQKISAALMVVGAPTILNYSVEIRMYGWAMLFVSLAFYSYSEALQENGNQSLNYLKIYIFSMLASYTHYYACVACSLFYIILFINNIKEKNSYNFIHWICCSIATIATYLPWLFVLIKQFTKVSESYWINPMSIDELNSYLIFVFGYYSMLPIFIIVLSFMKFKQSIINNNRLFLTAMFLFVWVIFVGLTVSFLTRPVFVIRYAMACLAIMWIALYLFIDKWQNKKSRVMAQIYILTFCFFNIFSFIKREGQDYINVIKIEKVIDEIGDCTIYAEAPESALFLSFISDNTIYTSNNLSDYEMLVYGKHIIEVNSVSDIYTIPGSVYAFEQKNDDKSELDWEYIDELFEEEEIILYKVK